MDYNKTWEKFGDELYEEVQKRFSDEQILECSKEYYDFISGEIKKWFEKNSDKTIYEDKKVVKVEDI